MKKVWFRLVSLIIITLLVLTGIVLAQDAGTAEIEFSAKETADDIIELDVTVKNATFMGIQTALRYDKDVLVPVDENGEQTTSFRKFLIESEEAESFSTIGLVLDVTNGYFGFTYYIMPGAGGENINESNEYVADGEGVSLCKFRFKKISNQDYSFEIITREETNFSVATDPGLLIMDYATGALKADVLFSYEDKEPQQTTIVAPEPEKPEVTKPQFTSNDRKKDVVLLQIEKNISIAYGKKALIDPENNKVVPYISNDRTLVPLRFVAETLGAEVLWEEGWDGCIIKKGETEIKLTFGSADFTVNGEKVSFDAPVEMVHDRTMVPIRFVSEQLGCNVYWNDLNKAVVISPADNPWVEGREAEITALNEMLVTLLPIMQ